MNFGDITIYRHELLNLTKKPFPTSKCLQKTQSIRLIIKLIVNQ